MLTGPYDLEEIVDLFALGRTSRSSELVPVKIATLPLREAVVVVIEEWADDKFKQLSAVIHMHSGPTIRSLDDIRQIYECAIS